MFDDDDVDVPDGFLCALVKGCTDDLMAQFWKDVRNDPTNATFS